MAFPSMFYLRTSKGYWGLPYILRNEVYNIVSGFTYEFDAPVTANISNPNPGSLTGVTDGIVVYGASGASYPVETVISSDGTHYSFYITLNGQRLFSLFDANLDETDAWLGITTPSVVYDNVGEKYAIGFGGIPGVWSVYHRQTVIPNMLYTVQHTPARISRYGHYKITYISDDYGPTTPPYSIRSDYQYIIDDILGNDPLNPPPYNPFDPPPYDPYNPSGGAGGDSGDDEGGTGTLEPESDSIPMSTIPTISSANTGFTRIYNPTLAQVRSLSNYLWTDTTILQTLWNQIKQFLENPMDAFIAFNLVPCVVPSGGTEEFKLMFIPTGVQLTVATSQFVDVDCGSYKIEPYYGSALDYSPYTKVSLFLPYIGTVQLDTDEVMGKTVSVKYRIDIVSGGCVAHVMVDGSVTYQYSGHCAINIPFTSADFTGYVSAMIQAAKAVTSLAAGATGAGALASELAGLPSQRTGSVNETITTTMRNPATGRQITSGRQVTERESVTGTNASFASLVAANVVNTVNTVMGSKPLVERSGTFSGTTGYLGVRRPYLIIEIPRIANPAKYGEFNGRPCAMTLKLGDLSGFTQVQQVQLTNFTATNPELDEIGGFLKSGVIL